VSARIPLEQPSDPELKLGEMMLYIAARLASEPTAGSTKLNKLLFFAEFAHMRATGQPITGVEYQKLPNGPAPRRLLPVRNHLVASGAAEVVEDWVLGRVQHRLKPIRRPYLQLFAESELNAIDEVLTRYGHSSETALSDISHREPAWSLVNEGETIPYTAAFLRTGRPGNKALARARELANERGIAAS
jgi:uncharacterized phage-associated protein